MEKSRLEKAQPEVLSKLKRVDPKVLKKTTARAEPEVADADLSILRKLASLFST